jgi:hypothetical protein
MPEMTHVQIDFVFSGTAAEYGRIAEHVAPAIAVTPGLVSKLWIIDEGGRRAGGAYLFADGAAAAAYLEGPVIAQLRKNPAVTDISVRRFNVIPGPSATTRGVRGA